MEQTLVKPKSNSNIGALAGTICDGLCSASGRRWLGLAASLSFLIVLKNVFWPSEGAAMEEILVISAFFIFEVTRDFWSRSPKPSVSKGVTEEALLKAASAGDLESSEDMLNSIKNAGGRPTDACYEALIHTSANTEQPVRAEKWLSALLAVGGRPCVECVNAVINAFAKAGNLAKAEEWLIKMEELGIEADESSYNLVMDACVDADEAAEEAAEEAWLRRMKAAAGSSSEDEDEDEDCEDDVDSLERKKVKMTAEIQAYAKAGNVAKAEELLAQMAKLGIADATSYEATLEASCCAEDPDAAEAKAEAAWLRRMLASRSGPQERHTWASEE